MSVLLQMVVLIAFSAVSMLIHAVPASAKVRVIERTKYYTVSGKTGRQLVNSITRKGPKTKKVGHAIATTLTAVEVKNIKPGIRGGRCIVKGADVVVTLTYTFPRWKNQRRASRKLRSNWRKFMKQVRSHEAKHGRISKNYASRLNKEIRKLSGRVSKKCRDFGSRSMRKLKRIEKQFLRQHAKFDRRESRNSSRIRRLQRALLVSR